MERSVARAIVVVLAAAAFVVAGCQHQENPRGGDKVSWDGPVHAIPGSSRPSGVVEFDGWEHCQWQSIRFLGVPAQAFPGEAGKTFLEYVDTTPAELPLTVGDFDPEATLPPDAVQTEYTDGDRELWFSPAEGTTYAYIVHGESVERWPRFDGGCD